MNIQTINTPEKLHQVIVKFLESNYSHEDLVETYNDIRKCVIRFRGIYSTLPALPACKDNPLDGLQDVMEWCNEASEVIDDIVFNLERQNRTISAIIIQLKKLRDFPSRVLSLLDNKLREQAQNEARAKVEKEYKNLNDKVSRLKLEKMLLIDQAKVVGELQLEEREILRRETKEVVQIYLSKDPTFKDRISQLNNEINEVLETLNKLAGSNTPIGKLLDIYCKLKDIPLQRQFDNVGYAYSPINDLTDVICGGCKRLYTSVDNVIKTFEEIQTKAEQKADLASTKESQPAKGTETNLLNYLNCVFDDLRQAEAAQKNNPHVNKYIRTELSVAYHETHKAVENILANQPEIKQGPADSDDPKKYLENAYTWCIGLLNWENGERIGAETKQNATPAKGGGIKKGICFFIIFLVLILATFRLLGWPEPIKAFKGIYSFIIFLAALLTCLYHLGALNQIKTIVHNILMRK